MSGQADLGCSVSCAACHYTNPAACNELDTFVEAEDPQRGGTARPEISGVAKYITADRAAPAGRREKGLSL